MRVVDVMNGIEIIVMLKVMMEWRVWRLVMMVAVIVVVIVMVMMVLLMWEKVTLLIFWFILDTRGTSFNISFSVKWKKKKNLLKAEKNLANFLTVLYS